MTSPYFPIQIILPIMAAIFLSLILHKVVKNKIKWYNYVLCVSYLVHIIIFYSFHVVLVLYGTSMGEVTGIKNLFELWSTVIRIHSVATVGLGFLLKVKQ